jgi:hypothetical protein
MNEKEAMFAAVEATTAWLKMIEQRSIHDPVGARDTARAVANQLDKWARRMRALTN